MENQPDTPTGSPLPEDPNQRRLERYRRDLERAEQELEEEKHKPLGLYDDLVNLLCFIETPEERLHKNRQALAEIAIPPTVVGSLAKRVASAIAGAVS